MLATTKTFIILLIYWMSIFSSIALSDPCKKKNESIQELKAEIETLQKRAEETVIKPLRCDGISITPSLSNDSQYYIVLPGDYLSKIVENHGFHYSQYKTIWRLHNQRNNLEKITDPNTIKPGLKLYIPSVAEFNYFIENNKSHTATVPDKQIPLTDPYESGNSNDISIAGSSTVYPLTVRAAECYRQAGGYKGTIKIRSTGTLDGIEKLCGGQFDMANASKEPDDQEAKLYGCNNSDNKLIKLHVAVDAVGIFINKNNPFFKSYPDISLDINEDLPLLLNHYIDWKELYENSNLRDNNLIEPLTEKLAAENLEKYFPTLKSGTLEFLVEKMYQKQLSTDEKERRDQIIKWKQELVCNATTTTEDDFMVADMISKNRNAVGVLGFSYIYNNPDLIPIKINGLEPRLEEINTRRYKLVRDLFIYTTNKRIKYGSKAICGFLKYYSNTVDNYVADVGYAVRTEDDAKASREELNRACPNQ